MTAKLYADALVGPICPSCREPVRDHLNLEFITSRHNRGQKTVIVCIVCGRCGRVLRAIA
jgi:RNase P subunit RPR2